MFLRGGCFARLYGWGDESGLAGVGGSFRSAGRGESAGDGDRGRRALSAEGVGEQVDEGVDGDGVVVGVLGDEFLPAVGAAEDVGDEAAFDESRRGRSG